MNKIFLTSQMHISTLILCGILLIFPTLVSSDSTVRKPTKKSGIIQLKEHDPKNNPFKGQSNDELNHSCYKLTFSDEFDRGPISASKELGDKKYRTQYYWGDEGINNELQYYADPKFHQTDVLPIKNGKLYITARKLKRPITSSKNKLFHYSSGLITTQSSFKQTYGLFEVRAKLPRGRGLWPAFWLLPDNHKTWRKRGYSRMPEIDVIEQLGDDMHTWYATMHTKVPPYKGGTTAGKWNIFGTDIRVKDDLSEGFHTYAVDWQADELVWYFDNVPVKREPTPKDVKNDPRYLLLNLAVGGKWPGNPDKKTVFPAEYVIDYIRVYSKKNRCEK